MNRDNLNLKATIFESLIGSRLVRSFQESKLVYDKRLKCSWLKRNETQIDLIMVTKKAVYVIEAKDWSRLISGDYGDYEWKGLGNHPQLMTVTSPYLQNMLHVRMLKAAFLKYGHVMPPIFNIICVPDSCSIDSNCIEIVNLSNLVSRIKNIENRLTSTLNVYEVVSIIRRSR